MEYEGRSQDLHGKLMIWSSRAPFGCLHLQTEVLMRHRVRIMYAAILVATVLLIVLPLAAQSTSQRTNEQKQALLNAHKADFDYLLGDWEFTGTNRQYG